MASTDADQTALLDEKAAEAKPASSPAEHAKEVAGYLAQCLSLLPMSLYLSSDQRQRLQQLAGGSGKRLRFDPEFADPAGVLAMLAKAGGQGKDKGKDRKQAVQAAKAASGILRPPKTAKAEVTRQELQARLQARMEQLRAQRKAAIAAAKDPNGPDAANGQSAKKRRNLKRKESVLKKRVQNLATAAASGKQQQPQQGKKQAGQAAATYNKDGKILYSKFDLVAKAEMLGSDTMGSRRAADKSKRRQKQLERRLVPAGSAGNAASVAERIERLKAADPAKAARLAEKSRWEKAMARAEGVKVKDDPTKLARTEKRQASLRRAKARKWEQREEGVRQRQADRQEKRQANIKARKDQRINKKIERAKKRGRILPELHGGGK